ncbi:MAG: hypothetical protein CAF45_003890 [Nitrospira sp. CG24E]|nr:MAG: hypothetical protein CAF45_003890 [Nitrospira sp. CG24E]
MKIDLHIARYKIRLSESQDLPSISWPLHPFGSFLDHSDRQPDIETAVTVVEELPNLTDGPLQFDACHGLWRLYETDAGLLLESLDTKTHQPCALALITKDFSRVDVWTRGEKIGSALGWVPMKIINPIVEVCLLTRLAREGGILLHSAGVLSPTGGYIFTGASGTGKSTLSGFFDARGASVLSDERMIIRKDEREFVTHGTPWVGSGAYAKNESGLLRELFCIGHGPQHQIENLSPAAALALILPQCFLPHWDRAAMESTLAFLSDLVSHIPCRRLIFAKCPDIVDYVQNQLEGIALVAP